MMNTFYVEFTSDKLPAGWGWTTVDAADAYDAKVIVHNRLYIPMEDITEVAFVRFHY